MKKIAIFASGTGSNARKIIEYFADREDVSVSLVVSNKAKAGVLDMAKEWDIDRMVINRALFYETEDMVAHLKQWEIDLIVLAGFLWLIPSYLVTSYAGRILNIHPALLPAYGGKGMYGMHVHRAVKAAGERESGMTIHLVNEHYDEGDIIFQARCPIAPEDEAEDIAKKVLALEHRHFASTIDQFLRQE